MGAWKWVGIVAAVLVLGIGGFAAYLAWSFFAGAEPAVIDELSGDVEVVKGGVVSSASVGMELAEGDTVRTRQGEVTIVLFGGSILRLDVDSEIVLTELKAETGVVRVTLASGEIWNRVVRASDDPTLERAVKVTGLREYTVEMADAVATVRGTGFGCSARGPSSVSVAHGTVGFKSKISGSEVPVSKRTAVHTAGKIEQKELVTSGWVQRNLDKDTVFDKKLLSQLRDKYGTLIEYVKSTYGFSDADIDKAILEYLASGGGKVSDEVREKAEQMEREAREDRLGERIEGGGEVVGIQRGSCGQRKCDCAGGEVTKKSSKSKTIASSEASASDCPALQAGGEGRLTGSHRGASWTATFKGSSVSCYGESTISGDGSSTKKYAGASEILDYCEPETYAETCSKTDKKCADGKAAAEADAQAEADQQADDAIAKQEDAALGDAQNAREACLNEMCRG